MVGGIEAASGAAEGISSDFEHGSWLCARLAERRKAGRAWAHPPPMVKTPRRASRPRVLRVQGRGTGSITVGRCQLAVEWFSVSLLTESVADLHARRVLVAESAGSCRGGRLVFHIGHRSFFTQRVRHVVRLSRTRQKETVVGPVSFVPASASVAMGLSLSEARAPRDASPASMLGMAVSSRNTRSWFGEARCKPHSAK